MPSLSILIRGAKEPVDSGRPCLKPSTKEKKREEKEKSENTKSQRQKKVRQEKSDKSSPRDMIPDHMGTQYHQNTSQKIFQVKGGTFS